MLAIIYVHAWFAPVFARFQAALQEVQMTKHSHGIACYLFMCCVFCSYAEHMISESITGLWQSMIIALCRQLSSTQMELFSWSEHAQAKTLLN